MNEQQVYQWDKLYTQNQTVNQLKFEEVHEEEHSPTSSNNRNNMPNAATDIQGIPWIQISKMRSQYRRDRLDVYEQYATTQSKSTEEMKPLGDLQDLKPELMPHLTYDRSCFYQFAYNARMVNPGLTHFQLRHLISPVSYQRKVLYLEHRSCLSSFDPITKTKKTELDLRNRAEPPVVSTLTSLGKYAILGSFKGDIILHDLHSKQILYDNKISTAQNSITNHIQLVGIPSTSSLLAVVASNDSAVRFLSIGQAEREVIRKYDFEFCVNHAAIPPTENGKNSKLVSVLGDDHFVHILDYSSPSHKPIFSMPGHLDYCFAGSWHPTNDNYLVTGSQDRTARVWDIRVPTKSVQLLCGCVGPVRNITFSVDGRFLAFSEPADFVHVYSADTFPTQSEQMLDIFGEISGIGFSDCDSLDKDSLFIGIFDRHYNSLLQFDRIVNKRAIDFVLV